MSDQHPGPNSQTSKWTFPFSDGAGHAVWQGSAVQLLSSCARPKFADKVLRGQYLPCFAHGAFACAFWHLSFPRKLPEEVFRGSSDELLQRRSLQRSVRLACQVSWSMFSLEAGLFLR